MRNDGLQKVRPLRTGYVAKVLPLVYDDSLSYYEVLSKTTAKINEIVNVIDNELEDYIREQLDRLFINSMYIPETETLVLILENPNE